MNTEHYLANWQKEGEWASYKINVHTPGFYKVLLIHEIEHFGDLMFKIDAGTSSVISSLADSGDRDFGTLLQYESAYWENFDLKETFRKEIRKSDVGQLYLDKGNSILKVNLVGVKDGHVGDIQDCLIAIHLIRTEQY